MFKRIDTTFLPVRDLDRAIAWYTQTLGFTLLWKQANYATIKVSETALTLYQPETGFTPVTGHARFNFYTTDVEAAHQTLRTHGASVEEIRRLTNFAWFDFKDPDGNQLGICWYPS